MSLSVSSRLDLARAQQDIRTLTEQLQVVNQRALKAEQENSALTESLTVLASKVEDVTVKMDQASEVKSDAATVGNRSVNEQQRLQQKVIEAFPNELPEGSVVIDSTFREL